MPKMSRLGNSLSIIPDTIIVVPNNSTTVITNHSIIISISFIKVLMYFYSKLGSIPHRSVLAST